MSKAVKPDFEFNIEKFSNLLERAKGGRSQSEFAKDCGISPAYLNRYINRKVEKAPIPTTIKKIAAVAANNISYKELLEAAGYDPEKYLDIAIISNSNPSDRHLLLSKIAYTTILNSLSNIDYPWRLYKTPEKHVFDFSIIIDNDDINKWYFSPHFSTNPEATLNRAARYYSNILYSGADSKSKYSFVTNSESLLEYLYNNPPHILNLLVSVILFNEKDLSIIKEVYLTSSTSLNDDIKAELQLYNKNDTEY